MANLAVVGSNAFNGVAELHTQLLEENTLRDFYQAFPTRFSNKTNSVTPRRWFLLSNPALAALIDETIGTSWHTDLYELRGLEKFADDSASSSDGVTPRKGPRHRWQTTSKRPRKLKSIQSQCSIRM
jgi:starch phosphorylase